MYVWHEGAALNKISGSVLVNFLLLMALQCVYIHRRYTRLGYTKLWIPTCQSKALRQFCQEPERGLFAASNDLSALKAVRSISHHMGSGEKAPMLSKVSGAMIALVGCSPDCQLGFVDTSPGLGCKAHPDSINRHETAVRSIRQREHLNLPSHQSLVFQRTLCSQATRLAPCPRGERERDRPHVPNIHRWPDVKLHNLPHKPLHDLQIRCMPAAVETLGQQKPGYSS